MKKTYKFFLFLSISLIYFSCNNNDLLIEQEPEPTGRTADDVRKDFSNLVIIPGINDITLESATENVFWNFRIIMPEGASDTNKKPLIFSLHGGASNVYPDAHKSSSCLLDSGFDALNPYIISPNSNGKLWYEQANQSQILALLELTSTYLFVDTQKIALTGFSDGGNGSFFFAKYFPTLFSAAIPIATSFNPASTNGNVDKIDIPIYAIHGSDDQLFPIDITQGYIDQLITAGTNIQFITAIGLDHYSSCSEYLTYLQDAAEWLSSIWN
jgi:predicted peptidase